MATRAIPAKVEFSSRTFEFLRKLQKNNNREWFTQNRENYETHVRRPALAFIDAMAPRLARISEHFIASSKPSGGSLMRVHRDMRFSRDGAPYKTNVGIQFRHVRGRDVHAPGFYVHIEPRGCFLGSGLWRPEPSALRAIRNEIAERPDAWHKATGNKRFTAEFELSGDTLQRPPKGFAAETRFIADIQRKDFIALAGIADSAVREADFVDNAAQLFRRTAPLMEFLCGALDLEY
jgi:uncharacterized protein (TIGR02453 family)